jgi:hypothetical protein
MSDCNKETTSTSTITTTCENQSNYEEPKETILDPLETISSGAYTGWKKYILDKIGLSINLPEYWIVKDTTDATDHNLLPHYTISNKYGNAEEFDIGIFYGFGACEGEGSMYDECKEMNYTFEILGKYRRCNGMARVRNSTINECESIEAFYCSLEEIQWEDSPIEIISFGLSDYSLKNTEIKQIFESIANPYEGWETYLESDTLFTFKFPPGWEKSSCCTEAITYDVYLKAPDYNANSGRSIISIIKAGPDASLTLAENQDLAEDLVSRYGGTETVYEKEIGGTKMFIIEIEGQDYDYTGTDGNKVGKIDIIQVVWNYTDNENVYHINLEVEQAQGGLNKYKQDFEKLIASFKVK